MNGSQNGDSAMYEVRKANQIFEIHTSRFGKARRINLFDLPIANTFAHHLPGPDLCRELQKLGIDGVTPTMGWQDLAHVYGNSIWIAAHPPRAAIQPPRHQQMP